MSLHAPTLCILGSFVFGLGTTPYTEPSYSLKEILVVFLCVTACRAQNSSPACDLQIFGAVDDHEYLQDGDLIIGGVFTINCDMISDVHVEVTGLKTVLCHSPFFHSYKDMLTFFYTIEELNKDPTILPNITLGYQVYDSCSSPRKALKSAFQVLSGPGKVVPNYSCTKNNLVGFLGDHYSSTSVPIAQIITGLYRYTQISLGAADNVFNDRSSFPSFFRTIQNEETSASVISELVKHFQWTWVGILASNDDNGERETVLLTRYLTGRGICVAFIVKAEPFEFIMNIEIIQKSTAQIIIICGASSFRSFAFLLVDWARDILRNKTFIINPLWASNPTSWEIYPDVFNLSLSFNFDIMELPDTRDFMNRYHPLTYPKDSILDMLWALVFHCSSGNIMRDLTFQAFYNLTLHECDGTERLLDIRHFPAPGFSGYVYFSTCVLAYVLNDIAGVRPWHELHKHLKKVICQDQTHNYYCFDENGGLGSDIFIKNNILLGKSRLTQKHVGYYYKNPKDGTNLRITKPLQWKTGKKVPISRCTASCLPGQRKVPGPSIHHCCHDCVPCPEGEISNMTDSKTCMRCPEDKWPNEQKSLCLPKSVEFLTYYDDVLSVLILVSSILFFIVTLLIICVFIKHWDTPIVKANNKTVSIILLVSILLVFLCVFLFLGHPRDITCLLRQVVFAILFTIAVSSLLAKTVMVYIAFKATKPGSVWSKWFGVGLPNFVVFFGSCPQVLICTIWLSVSPPFQELDTRSYNTKIIIQCNEGSVVGFYSVLGYMGILAAVSFILAFLARTLPDSYNEAKYITFSMLVFCSVWIAMIPAYLSTKGKYMVAVEIFAILTSNAGLLGCIFFPKCFIILCKPTSNTKTNLLNKTKS